MVRTVPTSQSAQADKEPLGQSPGQEGGPASVPTPEGPNKTQPARRLGRKRGTVAPERKTFFKQNARRYQIDSEIRVNISAICYRFGLNKWSFEYRQRRGWRE